MIFGIAITMAGYTFVYWGASHFCGPATNNQRFSLACLFGLGQWLKMGKPLQLVTQVPQTNTTSSVQGNSPSTTAITTKTNPAGTPTTSTTPAPRVFGAGINPQVAGNVNPQGQVVAAGTAPAGQNIGSRNNAPSNASGTGIPGIVAITPPSGPVGVAKAVAGTAMCQSLGFLNCLFTGSCNNKCAGG